MNRIKCVFAVLCLAAIVGITSQSQAQTVKVMIAGSSAMWQTLALGAYNNGTSIVASGWINGSGETHLSIARSSEQTLALMTISASSLSGAGEEWNLGKGRRDHRVVRNGFRRAGPTGISSAGGADWRNRSAGDLRRDELAGALPN